MKKLKCLFVALLICITVLACVGQGVVQGATGDENQLTILDLICLKKHLVGEPEYISSFDYNKDGNVDAKDLVALKILLLNTPFAPSVPDNDNSNVDDEGYNNNVVKP